MIRPDFQSPSPLNSFYQLIITGGGATGLALAVDAASRGYSVLLLEKHDFGKGTSSRSTKLVHGGIRYLAQGNLALVMEALRERDRLLKNAPHIVSTQAFIIPVANLWERLLYTTGLWFYDLLSRSRQMGRSGYLSRKKARQLLPGIQSRKVQGGVRYFDGQFEDARMAICLAQTAAGLGAHLVNYCELTGLTKNQQGKITGIIAKDRETGREFSISTHCVINATGVFADSIHRLDDPGSSPLICPSQGIHLILEGSFLPGENALMIPKTSDGRVLFAIPWLDKTLLGTTDTPVDHIAVEPLATEKETDFILETASNYFIKKPVRKDILSVFAGLRPLMAPGSKYARTKDISRRHKILVSPSGLITLTGGKWTTCRKMAEDALNRAIQEKMLPPAPCISQSLRLHGYTPSPAPQNPLSHYGSDADNIRDLCRENPSWAEKIHPEFPYIWAEVVWAIRFEMARSVEDILARRLRALFLNARASCEMAPSVAAFLARERQKDEGWAQRQIEEYCALARNYHPPVSEK